MGGGGPVPSFQLRHSRITLIVSGSFLEGTHVRGKLLYHYLTMMTAVVLRVIRENLPRGSGSSMVVDGTFGQTAQSLCANTRVNGKIILFSLSFPCYGMDPSSFLSFSFYRLLRLRWGERGSKKKRRILTHKIKTL